MLEWIWKYISVLLVSMVKFGLGPVVGIAGGLHPLEIILLMILGMMLTVVFLSTFLGDIVYEFMKNTFYKNAKVFSPKTRRIVKIWNTYGMYGIAFLTPVLLSPIGGTLVSITFGESKTKIFLYMLVSALFWAPITVYFMEAITHFFTSLWV
ncbi:MAG: hypothetical protein MUE33_11545 [Cytophagaceae bacterium]|jgi:uncharacterized membrane protein|nr:hypothetical protein [Cytophagaceae bacterium]